MNKNLDVVEDIKQNITDYQYKLIMVSLMEIHKINNNCNLLPLLSEYNLLSEYKESYKLFVYATYYIIRYIYLKVIFLILFIKINIKIQY